MTPVFDRNLVRRHIERAKPHFADHSALFDDTAPQLEERLGEIRRSFSNALDLSPFPFLKPSKKLSVLAPSPALDEETLSVEPGSFDLIVSNLSLHWANNLPEALMRIRLALKKDGLFLAALIGGRSLFELRECLLDAEIALANGASPRVSKMIDLQSAGDLMREAGFHLPVADLETVTLLYKDTFALMHELRGMGQTNALTSRLRRPTRRALFAKADELYKERFADDQGLIPATFDVIFLHGWA